MTTAIAVRPDMQGLQITSLVEAERMASKLAPSALIPDTLRNKPADVMVIMITGHELGLSPMQSLRGLHVIKGRPVMAAELIVGLVKRSPACRYLQLVESTDARAIYETQREGEPKPTTLAWTIEQARAAGLAGGDNWKRHPAAMLRARCSAAICRAVYPDVMLGILEEGEAEEAFGRAHQVEGNTRPPPIPPPAPADDVTDAEIVQPDDLPPMLDDAPDEASVDPIQTWTERIQGTPDLAALSEAGKILTAEYPDKRHPVRVAVSPVYLARRAALQREAQP